MKVKILPVCLLVRILGTSILHWTHVCVRTRAEITLRFIYAQPCSTEIIVELRRGKINININQGFVHTYICTYTTAPSNYEELNLLRLLLLPVPQPMRADACFQASSLVAFHINVYFHLSSRHLLVSYWAPPSHRTWVATPMTIFGGWGSGGRGRRYSA